MTRLYVCFNLPLIRKLAMFHGNIPVIGPNVHLFFVASMAHCTGHLFCTKVLLPLPGLFLFVDMLTTIYLSVLWYHHISLFKLLRDLLSVLSAFVCFIMHFVVCWSKINYRFFSFFTFCSYGLDR